MLSAVFRYLLVLASLVPLARCNRWEFFSGFGAKRLTDVLHMLSCKNNTCLLAMNKRLGACWP